MTLIEELKHRIACVKAATGAGYGEKKSLVAFRGAALARIAELDPLVVECRRNAVLAADDISKQLQAEHSELLYLCKEAEEVIGNPDIPGVDIYKNTP